MGWKSGKSRWQVKRAEMEWEGNEERGDEGSAVFILDRQRAVDPERTQRRPNFNTVTEWYDLYD